MFTEKDKVELRRLRNKLDVLDNLNMTEKARAVDLTDKAIKAIDVLKKSFVEETESNLITGFFTASCTGCSWWGPSSLMESGNEVTCPICGCTEIVDKIFDPSPLEASFQVIAKELKRYL